MPEHVTPPSQTTRTYDRLPMSYCTEQVRDLMDEQDAELTRLRAEVAFRNAREAVGSERWSIFRRADGYAVVYPADAVSYAYRFDGWERIEVVSVERQAGVVR